MKEPVNKTRIMLCNAKDKYYNIEIKSLKKKLEKFNKLKESNLNELEALTK